MIPRNPVFTSDLVSVGKNGSLPYPLNTKHSYLYGYARVALYEGLKLLEIKPGENLLIPNYICNVVVAALRKLLVNPKFYPLNNDLTPQWGQLEKVMDKKTRGLIVVNYFGFPNDLERAREFCQKYKIFLIEDNAHGFLSSDGVRPLGSFGDISIFSLRKTLPLPNAAVLVVNNGVLQEKAVLPCSYSRQEGRNLRFLIKSACDTLSYYFKIKPLAGSGRVGFGKTPLDTQEEFNLDKYFVACSNLSKYILAHINLSAVIAQRRMVYLQWKDFFKKNVNYNVKIIFSVLSEGIMPYVFPVLVDNPKSFVLAMRKNGVACFTWPFLPVDAHEEYLSKRTVCLPLFAQLKLVNLKGN